MRRVEVRMRERTEGGGGGEGWNTGVEHRFVASLWKAAAASDGDVSVVVLCCDSNSNVSVSDVVLEDICRLFP